MHHANPTFDPPPEPRPSTTPHPRADHAAPLGSVRPRRTEVIAREDVLEYLEDIYRAISQDTPEAWGLAADAARKIENACTITRDALILRQQRLTPLPFDMAGFAADCLRFPNIRLERKVV